jgi:hypothetical protein
MSISAMFEQLGAPLANIRWSWGGIRPDGTVVLRVWQNETKRIDSRTHIQLTHRKTFVGRENNLGYQERLAQVERVRSGVKCHMIMCIPKDTKTEPREIKRFIECEIFVAGDVIEHDGDYWVPIAARESIH